MIELTGTLANSEAILNYSFTPHCENNEMVKVKDATIEDEDEILGTSSTVLHGDILTKFDFVSRVTYTYKTYYGPWFGLCKYLKKLGIKDNGEMNAAYSRLIED